MLVLYEHVNNDTLYRLILEHFYRTFEGFCSIGFMNAEERAAADQAGTP